MQRENYTVYSFREHNTNYIKNKKIDPSFRLECRNSSSMLQEQNPPLPRRSNGFTNPIVQTRSRRCIRPTCILLMDLAEKS